MRRGPEAEGRDERQRRLLAAADEMHAEGRIGDELWGRLAAAALLPAPAYELIMRKMNDQLVKAAGRG